MSLEEQLEEAEQKALLALERIPGEDSWGLFVDTPHPCGLGPERGRFMWFDRQEDLMDFLGRYCVSWASLRESPADDFQHIVDAVANLVARMASGEVPLGEGVQELSDWLYEFNVEIIWAGALKDLLADPGEFPCEVRAWFRQHETGERSEAFEDKDDAPIREREREAFLGVLMDYGLEEDA